jgi:hypothetical protein
MREYSGFNSTLARFILLTVWHGAVIIGKRSSCSADDYLTFAEIVASQKSKLPLYLYAYCLRIEESLSVCQRMSGLSREELRSNNKRRGTVAVKEAVIVLGRRGGI